MDLLEKYKNAIWHTKTSKKQQQVFGAWCKNKSVMGIDTETTGVIFGVPTVLRVKAEDERIVEKSGPTVFGMSLAIECKDVINLFWARIGTPLFKETSALFATKGPKTAHNARYDIRVCRASGLKIAPEVECTYTMSRIYWDRRKKHSLQSLIEMLCPELSDWEEPVKAEMRRLRNKYTRAGYPKDYVNYSFLPEEIISPYAMTDAFMALMLYKYLWPKIYNDFHNLYEREKKVFHIINKVESRGLRFDAKKARRKAKPLKIKMNACCKRMESLVGAHNPNSPKQVLAALIGELRIPRKMLTLKGKLTTEVDTLRQACRQLENESTKKYIENLLERRSYIKTINTYLEPLARRAELNKGIVLCSINPADTRTLRMASRDPNLQNIPEIVKRKTGRPNPVRSCFICRDGYCNYYFDYSQMEMAIFGLWTQEETILEAYKKGEDIHDKMASYLFGKKHTTRERDVTKNINFGIIYGMGVKKMALTYDMSLIDAKRHLRRYEDEFPSIRRFQWDCKTEIQQNGYVEDWFGHRYHVGVGEAYKAVNCLVQGSCAQIFKIALISIEKHLSHLPRRIANILLPVHDEFQIELEKDFPDEQVFIDNVVICMMEIHTILSRGLKLRVDVSKSSTNWAEKEKINV